MLERAECKVLLVLLLILSLLALASTISALIISILWQYVGFLMSDASFSYLCSTYQTLKLHNNIIYNYNAIFIGACCSILFSLLVVIHLAYLAKKYCKSDLKYFDEFTQSIYRRLYIGISLSLLGLCVCVGYYLSYIIEQGWSCLNFIYTDWLIIGSIFMAALVFLLIAWIYLLCFWLANKHKFDQPKEQRVQKSSEIQQPKHMKQLFEAMREEMKHKPEQETKKSIKKPLLEEEDEQDEQDKASYKEPERQKLEIIPFEQYKKMQKQKQQKERTHKLQQEVLMQLLHEQQEKRIREEREKLQQKRLAQQMRRQYIKNNGISPDDPNFESMLFASDNEDEDKLKQQKLKEQQKLGPYFPSNFVPKNEKERQSFQKYKKNLLNKYKNKYNSGPKSSSSNEAYTRHPQNIEGGRSRKSLKKFLKKNKRPSRDESMYIRSNFDPNQDKQHNNIQMILEQNEGDLSQKSAQPNWIEPKISVEPPPSAQKSIQKEQPKQKLNRFFQNEEQEPQVLCFSKTKTKSPNRKKLFQQEQNFLTNQNFSSVLSSLVKGVQQVTFKNKLKQLKQKRHQSQVFNKSKRSQKLLDSIRSKFI